jgi:hypothetical protein
LRVLAREQRPDAPARLAPQPGFTGLVAEFHAIAAAVVEGMRATLGAPPGRAR